LPNSIENLGMLRGLSTHVAVIKSCDKKISAKISFLLNTIEQQNLQLIQLFNKVIPEIDIINNYQKLLYRLLLMIKISILDSPNVTVDGDLLFELSTDIIDSQWMAINLGVQRVEDLSYRSLVER
jgi:hypothetical protein